MPATRGERGPVRRSVGPARFGCRPGRPGRDGQWCLGGRGGRADAGMAGAVTTVDDIGAESGRITTVLALQSMIAGGPPGNTGTATARPRSPSPVVRPPVCQRRQTGGGVRV